MTYNQDVLKERIKNLKEGIKKCDREIKYYNNLKNKIKTNLESWEKLTENQIKMFDKTK